MSTGRLLLALMALGPGSPNYLQLWLFSTGDRFVPSRCGKNLSQQRPNTSLLPDKESFLDSMEGIFGSSGWMVPVFSYVPSAQASLSDRC